MVHSRGARSSTLCPIKPDAPVTTTFTEKPAFRYSLFVIRYWSFLPGNRVVIVAIPVDRLFDAALERHGRLVAEQRHRFLDRGDAQLHFGSRMRLEDDLRLRIGQPQNQVGQLEVGGRPLWVADVEGVA